MASFTAFLLLLYTLVTSQGATGDLPAAPSYIYTMDGDVCVYEGSTPEDRSPSTNLSHQCFVHINSASKVSMEMDLQAGILFIHYSDHIMMVEYTEEPEIKLLTLSAGEIQDFAYDWIARNLYFADKTTDSVQAVSYTGDHALTVLEEAVGIMAVTVDPINRYLFWTTSTTTGTKTTFAIGRSALDGSNRNDQFFTDVTYPTALVMDHKEKRLCWTDTNLGSIECVDIDGTNHVTIFEDYSTYPAALAVDEDYVIWLNDLGLFPEVYWTDKVTGDHTHYDYHFTWANMDDILLYGEYSQPAGHLNVCSNQNGRCSQLCFALAANQKVCRCSLGFVLAEDGTSCQPAERNLLQRNLLVGDAGRGNIYFYNTETGNVSALGISPQTDVQDVAIDPVHGYVFWANIIDDTIGSAKLDGSDVTVVKTFPNGHTIVGLAVDYIDQLLFYCDVEADGVVMSISYNGEGEVQLLKENHTLAIVVDMENKHLFLAIAGRNSRIIQINYDGSGERTLVERLYLPLAFTVDFQGQRLYWFDDLFHLEQYLEWSDLDGGNRGRWGVSWHRALRSLAVVDGIIYLVDWNAENQLARVHKDDVTTFEFVGPNEFLHLSRIQVIPNVCLVTVPVGLHSTVPTPKPVTTTRKPITLPTANPPVTSSVQPPTLSHTPSQAASSTPSHTPSQAASSTPSHTPSQAASSTQAIAPNSNPQTGDTKGKDTATVSLVAGITVAVVVLLIAAVMITGCIVYRRRKAPPDHLISDNNAFENPGYAEVPAAGLHGSAMGTRPHAGSGASVGYAADEVHIYQSLGLPRKE